MQPQSQTEFEHEMERRNNTAVIFKNIDSEDFTHTYGGTPYTVKVGEKVILTYPVAMLLAGHLAMKILRRKKTGKFQGQKGDVEKTLNLYPPAEIADLKSQIILEQIEQPLDKIPSEAEKEALKIKELGEKFKDRLEDAPAKVEVTKKEVIAELLKKGIKFNPRDTKEGLLQLITDNEMKG